MGKTYQSIVINAPVAKVWSIISDFHDMTWASNVITDLKTVGDQKGNEPGARRILNGAIHETLKSVDHEKRTFIYSVDDGPSPISKEDVRNYIGCVILRPITEGSGTFVEWTSSWEQNDVNVYVFCHGIYVALLTDLKKSLE